MVTLHYAPNPTGENMSEILHIVCDDFQDLIDTIEYETELKYGCVKKDIVYLCSFEDVQEEQAHILVDRNPDYINYVLDTTIRSKSDMTDVWLFTFTSFEDAYKTALDMKESCDYDCAFTYERKNK